MLSQSQIESLAPKAKIIQVIAGSLIMGVVVATGLLAFVGDMSEAKFSMAPLTLVGVAVLGISIAMSIFVPSIVAQSAVDAVKQKNGSDDSREFGDGPSDSVVDSLASVFQTKTIIQFALVEGACFLNAILILLEKSWVNIVAVTFGVFVMIVVFPTHSKLVQFVEEKIRR